MEKTQGTVESGLEKSPKRGRGRPKCFDPEAALEKAMMLFWDRGYEGTSMDDLSAAMGISPSSIYATYGDKQRLFQAALDRYREGPGAYTAAILDKAPSAYAAIEEVLMTAADELTRAGRPAGCMLANAVTHCAPQTEHLQQLIAERRFMSLGLIKQRFDRGILEGELPAGTDTCALARFFGTVLQGMTIQARDKVAAAELKGVASAALRAWPQEAPRQ